MLLYVTWCTYWDFSSTILLGLKRKIKIPWRCQLETNVPYGILSGVFNVDIMQHCLLMFNRLDFEGTLNDQRCNINLIRLVCDYFTVELDATFFEVLPFHGWELVRDFGGQSGIRFLKIFNKPSAINRFSMPLPTIV